MADSPQGGSTRTLKRAVTTDGLDFNRVLTKYRPGRFKKRSHSASSAPAFFSFGGLLNHFSETKIRKIYPFFSPRLQRDRSRPDVYNPAEYLKGSEMLPVFRQLDIEHLVSNSIRPHAQRFLRRVFNEYGQYDRFTEYVF